MTTAPPVADRLLDERLALLERELTSLGSVVVAFSGGADSALLTAAAVRALGSDRVLAATGDSASLSHRERGAAARTARQLGARHVFVRTHELESDGYRENSRSRCWFCKDELAGRLVELAAGHGLAHVATGTNADDLADRFRPGIRAAAGHGVVTPLAAAGLTKAQVRAASRRWGLPTWDKPASPCLSSRIAYGLTITRQRLDRVDAAEQALRESLARAGIASYDLRVRDLGERALIQVDRAAAPAVAARPEVLAAVRGAGFASVEVDPLGFRSGSLNTVQEEVDSGP
ncbi:ExsB family transcriptional regulator [Kitasatospora phosalacinea]|uniref:ExsB family transcriptional regulator n=1 Tax=Kitasatospora phosalacinea TaxID=2065 RepID=A0A9W6QEX7_9ACTN|nr:ATP-dependent sacrificial sulfur transferase LarE [Kitasatospora phosalacinea]GLW73257.1 ExsB family transcriptional regulator [Kitasatospora phosalacinea]